MIYWINMLTLRLNCSKGIYNIVIVDSTLSIEVDRRTVKDAAVYPWWGLPLSQKH